MPSPRLLLDQRVVSNFPGGVTSEVLTLFQPGGPIEPGVFRCGGRILLDRMDAMGVDADQAMVCLDDALELVNDAYQRAYQCEPDPGTSSPTNSGLDATDWLLQLSFDDDPWAVDWLLSLVEECDPILVLRLCLMARPNATVSLEVPEAHAPVPASGTRLVITQTRTDAEALRRCLRHELPHLSDLIRCTHLGGDESAEQLAEQMQGMAQLRISQPVTFVFREPASGEADRLLALPDTFHVLVTEEHDATQLLGHLLQTMGLRPAWHVG